MLKDKILTNSCTPEWVAQTYAQYLESKADDYTNLMSAVSSAISMDMESDMSQVEDEYDAVIKQLKDRITILADSEGINTKEMSADDEELDYFITATLRNDAEIKNIFTSHFVQTDKIRMNLKSLLLTYEGTYDGNENIDGVTGAGLFQYFKPYREACGRKATEVLGMYGIDANTPISLNHGYTVASDLFTAIISNANSNDSEYTQLQLNLKDIDDNDIQSQYEKNSDYTGYSLASLFDEVKNNYSCIVSYAAGFTASTMSTVADRLTYYNSYVGDRITALGSDAVNISRTIKSRLSDVAVTSSQFFDSFINLMGWDKATSTGDGLPTIIDSSKMYNYTGASPAGPLDFSQAVSTGERVVKTIGASLAAVGLGLWNLAKSAFSKASSYITEIAVNPFDIESLDNGSDSCLVDGFQYQRTESSETVDFKTTEYRDKFIEKYNSSYKDRWIGCKGIFGETLFKPDYIGTVGDTSIVFSYTSLFKPKSVSFTTLKRCSEIAEQVAGVQPHFIINYETGGYDFDLRTPIIGDNLTYDTNKTYLYWELFLYELSHANDLYVVKSDNYDERDFEIGYILATRMQQYANSVAANALSYYYPKADYASSLFDEDYGWFGGFNYDKDVFSQTNNLDLIKATCGYNENPVTTFAEFSLIPMNRIGHNTVNPNIQNSYFHTWHLARIIVQSWFDKLIDPLDYMYIPYSNDKTNFSAPQYRIKTDEDNWEAFNSFMTKVIIAVIILTVAVTAAVIVTKIMRKMYFKRAGEIAKLDSAMWSGHKLTSKEQRKYVRFSRKLNKSNLLTRGLVGTATNDVVNTVDVIGGKLDSMYTQLAGTAASPVNDIIQTSSSKDSDKSILSTILERIGK